MEDIQKGIQMEQIVLVLSYVAITIGIGIWTKRKAQSSKAFNGAELGILLCVVAGAGEWLGGTATTGVAEYGYDYGLSGAWYTIANGIGICFLALFFARLFRSLNLSTVSGIIGRYLGEKAKKASAALLIFAMIAVGSSQMVAVGTLGEEIFHISFTMSVLCLGSGILIYTVLGGMPAIGYTNILHVIIMYTGSIVAVILSLRSVGGIEELKNMLPASCFSITGIGIPRICSWLIASILGACVAQAGIQPILASRDTKTAVRSSYLIAAIVAPFGVLSALLGMIARVRFPGLENSKLALPALLMTMNPLAGGFVLASIMAAVFSTASPVFLACGTLFTRDIYTGRKSARGQLPGDTTLLRVSQMATFLSGSICIVLALLLYGSQRLLDIVYFAYSIRGSLFVILLLGIYWKLTSPEAAVWAMLMTGLVGASWILYKNVNGGYPFFPQFSETYASVIAALAVTVLGSFVHKGRKKYNENRKAEDRMESVVEYLFTHADKTPDRIAVIAGGRETTYKELSHMAHGYASFLRNRGLKKGDLVITKASQTLEYVIIYLGTHLAGGVITSLEKNISADGFSAVMRTVNARIAICDNDSLIQSDSVIFINDAAVMEDALNTSLIELTFPCGEDSADILFTTGTTGASKGVELSHRALVATAENLICGCGYRENTVLIVPGPLNHANAVRKLFTTLVNGSTICILNGMTNLKAFFEALNYPVGYIACCLPPSAIRTILQLTGREIGKYADRIDFIESATAPLPESDKVLLCELLPNTRLYNNYGSSEAASVCMYDYNANPGRTGCVGRAMPNSRIFTVNENKEVIRSSKENMGFLACAGDVNMKGYINEPELTRDVLIDGVIYTNDIGYIDEEGFVYIAGRKGDVINVGGFKVSPTEVEEAALSIDGIEDCICLPIEHAITGQALKLLVVMRGGVEFAPKKISALLKIRLEGYKVPVKYEQVDYIARTYNGKLDRKFYLK